MEQATDDLRVLFVDGEPRDVLTEQRALARHGLAFASRTAVNESELIDALAEFKPDVVLCDYAIPGITGFHALDTVHRLRPSTPILMVAGAIADDTAVECMNWGAIDYVMKSNLQRLGPAVRRAVDDTRRRRAIESRIEALAHYDLLTGLPNLAYMHRSMANSFEREREDEGLAGMAVLNLDYFRRFDERYGRQAAEQALREVGAALKENSRPFDCVARIGPNEFLVLLSTLDGIQRARTEIERLQACIAVPRMLDGREVRISATAGVALYPTDGGNFESLLCKATAAMHEAKTLARGGLRFHSRRPRRAGTRHQLEVRLRSAIEHGELSLAYQPQFDIRSGAACGVEALARWTPPGGGIIVPSLFIPLAERSGLIDELGAWALRSACAVSAQWQKIGRESPPLSVNVSPRQIGEAFTAEIAAVLDSCGLPPDLLELEIAENGLAANPGLALRCLKQWRSLGVRIALDDFGTGRANLGYLSTLPIDRLKIDGSFIRAMTSGFRDSNIVRAALQLGRALGLTVLAEGVETEEQLAMLRDFGCEQAQGFLLTPPTSPARARTLMDRRWGARAAVPDGGSQ